MGLDNPIHLAILLMILLLVFGAKRLPEMGRGLGDGMRSFKDAVSGHSSPTPALATTETHEDASTASVPTTVPATASVATAIPAE
jgi:sec-independent protein translocase protein TatA